VRYRTWNCADGNYVALIIVTPRIRGVYMPVDSYVRRRTDNDACTVENRIVDELWIKPPESLHQSKRGSG